jgi:hypothetical protein
MDLGVYTKMSSISDMIPKLPILGRIVALVIIVSFL